MSTKVDRFCVIRRYKDSDQCEVQSIISEVAVESVNDYFWSAVFSEVLPQMVILFMGFAYIILHVPFYFCLSGIPVAIAVMYIAIWAGHISKAMELSEEMNNIENSYMRDINTCFFVAEVYDVDEATELSAYMNKSKKVLYNFYTEKQFASSDFDIKGLKKHVVGTVAVTKSQISESKAWIRRFAVRKEYRRRHIAEELLQEAINFCTKRNYKAVQLVATECHYKARELFYKLDFDPVFTKYKYYFNVRQPIYYFSLRLKKDTESVVEESVPPHNNGRGPKDERKNNTKCSKHRKVHI